MSQVLKQNDTDKIRITCITPDGRKVLSEDVPLELWDRFEKRAEELNIPVDELFEIALDEFLEGKGY